MGGEPRCFRRLFFGPAVQPAAQQAGAPRPAHQLDVADQLGPAAPALQHDLSVVERFELGPVADADQRGLFRLLAQELHQLVLALGIERGGRLVEHDDVRVVQEDAGEGETLLLAARQRLVPRRLVLDALDQMVEADALEGFGDLLDLAALGGVRIGRGAAQACRSGCRAAAAAASAWRPF